jgi:hypothetical protein
MVAARSWIVKRNINSTHARAGRGAVYPNGI